MITSLSTEDYLHSPYWKVVLSNGVIAYGNNINYSWLELKDWLKTNTTVNIVKLSFCFRDNEVVVHEGVGDYFFTNALKAEYGGRTQYYYIGGYRDNDVVYCKKYIIPEIYLIEEETRPLHDLSVVRGLIEAK